MFCICILFSFFSVYFRMDLVDVLDTECEDFDKATHGGVALLKTAIILFRHMTKTM